MYRKISSAACLIILLSVSTTYADQDPMRPPNWMNRVDSSSVKNEKINLQQILLSKKRKIAIINNQIFREGQLINGNKIIKIEAEQIKIRRGEVNKIIKLLPSTKEVNREI